MSLYPNYNSNVPSPSPTFPSGIDVFAPPFSNYIGSIYAPIISEITSQGFADQTICLFGDAFNDYSTANYPFLLYTQTTSGNGAFTTPNVLTLTDKDATMTLAANSPSGQYLLWASNSRGYGNPIAINKTDAWWIGPDVVASGEITSVYGNNLSYGGIAPMVYIQPSGVLGVFAAISGSNNYKVDFQNPYGPGTYLVWTHNGHGGNYGWCGPLTLTVSGSTVNNGYSYWSGSTFNVLNYGAIGDGVTDNYQAIKSGIAAASVSFGNTLYLPSGTYGTKNSFNLFKHLRWSGDGIDKTIIQCLPGWSGSYLLGESSGQVGHGDCVEVTNMTISDNFNLTGTNSAAASYDLIQENSCNFLKFNNLKLICYSSGSFIEFKGSGAHVWLNNVTLVGATTPFGDYNQVFISGVSYSGVQQAGGTFGSTGGVGISITNCKYQDFIQGVLSGTCLGRTFDANSINASAYNLYVGNNTTTNYAPMIGAGNQNSGEQILIEGFGEPQANDSYTGPVTYATPNSIQVISNPSDCSGNGLQHALQYTITIIKGKGKGQQRYIISDNNSGLFITKTPWTVIPDQTSFVTITTTMSNFVAYGNNLNGKSDYIRTSGGHSSSAGVELFGAGGRNLIIDSNHITNTRNAIFISGYKTNNNFGTNQQVLAVNNTISGCLAGFLQVYVYAISGTNPYFPGYVATGHVIRNNTISGVGNIADPYSPYVNGINFQVPENSPYGSRYTNMIIEHNIISSGISLSGLSNKLQVIDYKNITI